MKDRKLKNPNPADYFDTAGRAITEKQGVDGNGMTTFGLVQDPPSDHSVYRPSKIEGSVPDMGARQMPGKSSLPDAFEYRFSTDTEVRTAKEVPGAKARAQSVQEGCNESKLLKSSPPTASSLKDGEETEFESGLTGTP